MDEHKQEIRGMKLVLKHARLKEEFSGWFRKEGTKAIFVEDATWIEVQVDLDGKVLRRNGSYTTPCAVNMRG